MDSELKQYLEAMQGDLTSLKQDLTSVKQDLTSVKQDLTSVKQDLTSVKQDLTSLKQEVGTLEGRIMARVDGRIDAVESRMKDFVGSAVHDLETKMIGEFWKWGRTADMRTRQALGESAALNERMLAVEDRVSALERRPS